MTRPVDTGRTSGISRPRLSQALAGWPEGITPYRAEMLCRLARALQ